MCCICNYCRTSKLFLKAAGGPEQIAFSLNNFINSVIITHHSAQIHRNDRLCPFRNGLLQLVIVHFIRPRSSIHQHKACAHMDHRAGRCGVSISTGNNLVPFPDAQHSENQFQAGSGRIKAYSLFAPAECSCRRLELFSFGAGCDPAAAHHIRHRRDFQLGDVRRGKQYVFHVQLPPCRHLLIQPRLHKAGSASNFRGTKV